MASGSKSISGGSDEAFLHDCDVCKYNNKTSEAISFCTVCTEYLCDVCDQTHKGLKATRDHKIITGSSMSSSSISRQPVLPYCERHKTMTLNVYCLSHDVVMCGTCKLTDHRKCKTNDVKQHRTTIKVKEAFGEAMRGMMDLKKKYEIIKETRQREVIKLEVQIKKCLEDVKEFRQRINDKLDLFERKLTKKASEVDENINKEIEGHMIILDDALNQINDRIKSLEVCQKTQNEDVMFVGMTKAVELKNNYDAVLSNIKQEIFSNKIDFEPNYVISDMLLQLESLGTLKIKKIAGHVSVLNTTVGERRDIDVGCRKVFDCKFIGDSHLVLTCGNDGRKLLDKHFKVQSQLPDFSLRVATINENEVIVTQGSMNQLQRVSILPNMAVTKTLKMDRLCWGVDVFNNEIYVTCHDSPGNGEVQVLNMDGTLQRQLGVSNGQYMFSRPNCIKVSRDGSKVFISDFDTSKVTCLSQQGDVLYQYTDRELKNPRGMYVDDEGNVLVCGGNSHNIHMIKHDGSKQKVLLSKKDGMKDPLCISYRPRDGCLVVGLYDKDKPLLIFKTKLE